MTTIIVAGSDNTSNVASIYKNWAIINDYVFTTTVLGTGRCGDVIKGRSKYTGESCAIKRLRDDETARREVSLHLRACDHPNIVKVTDLYANSIITSIIHETKVLYSVTEFMGGGDLFSRIHGRGPGAFSETEAASIVRDIGSAIRHLHDMDVSHGDVKPENVLYTDKTSEAELKLTDFAAAQEMGDGVATPDAPVYWSYYTAPEALRGGHKGDGKACDIWSLGVITYVLMCGYAPFCGESGQPLSARMVANIVDGNYCFPEEPWGKVSRGCKEFIRAMLETDPRRRPSVEDVLSHRWVAEFEDPPPSPVLSTSAI